jgi:flagellar hook protein FlgE
LCNKGTGAIIQGKLADAQGNLPSGSGLEDIKISLDTKSPAKMTTAVKLSGNLDSNAAINSSVPSTITAYDSLGNAINVRITYTKTADNTWSWTASVPALPSGAASPAVATGTGVLTYNGDGTLNSVSANTLTITPGNGADPLTIALTFGKPSLTVPGDFSGVTQTGTTDSGVSTRENDGYKAGTMTGIEVDKTGTIRGSFDNGQKQVLGQLMLAEFNNPGGLEKVGNNMWSTSANSGTPAIVAAGGATTLTPGALEQSNVDLSDEFTKMIVAQRGFQANARVITTSDDFLQEIVALKR